MAFGSPFFLAGLAAVGLPVLIHFLTRARPRRIRFPTFHLLVEAGTGRQALHRLRTWLVLAARTLLVAALVLAFARPIVRHPVAPTVPGDAKRVVLAIDASMSMRAVRQGVTLLARAKGQAADVLRGLPAGSAAAVVFIGARPHAVLPALSRNLSALHEGLAAFDATFENGDPAAALALAERMLEGQGEIYVFSDFQRTNFGAIDFTAFGGVAIAFRPMVEHGVPNAGITAVEIAPEEPVEGETVELTSTLFNASPDRRRLAVRLDLEGVSRTASVDLPPFGSASCAFSFSLPRAGTFPGTVSLTPDDLDADDRRFFRIETRQALRVLVLSDSAIEDGSASATFVAAALSPSQYAETGVDVWRRRGQDADRGALETADAFVLAPPLAPLGEAIEIIARRVNEGAPLICFIDGPTSGPVLAALAQASQGAIAPPFALRRPVEAPGEGQPFARMVTATGPLRLFHSPDDADLASLRFRRYFLTDNDPARSAEILLEFGDGSAALAFSPAGRGSAVYANLPVAPDGSNVAGSPLFPSILHELLRAMRRGGDGGRNVPGKPWQIEAAGEERAREGGGSYRVLDPEGQPLDVTIVARGRTARLAVEPAHVPGHYRVLCGATPAGLGVVNVDPKETDTREIDLHYLLKTGGPSEARLTLLDEEGEVVAMGVPLDLWPHCLALACLAAAMEMAILALWRGTRRGADPHPIAGGRTG